MPPRSADSSLQQLSLFDDVAPMPMPMPIALVPLPPLPALFVPPAPLLLPTPSASLLPSEFCHPRSQREIQLGPHRVAYELRRARRRSIGFVVGADGLSVSAPRWVGLGEVESALREKSAWILRKLHEQRERGRRIAATRVDWRDGAAIAFLGETVILVLDPRVTGAVLNSAAGAAALPGKPQLSLHLGLLQSAEPTQIRDAVQSWLQRQARRIFEERCAVFTARLGVRMTRLSLSSAATRWGSASASGAIRLNWRLVHFALPVIDYVVTHELAHLKEMNHSPAFWDVVRSALPAFEQARGALRTELLPAFD